MMFHSVPLNTKVELPYGEFIILLGLPSIVVDAVTVIGLILELPNASLTTNAVPGGLTGRITELGPMTLTAR